MTAPDVVICSGLGIGHGRTPWDAVPNARGGKVDAETAGLAAMLRHPNVTSMEGARVRRLLAGEGGRTAGVAVERDGRAETIPAPAVVPSSGAVSTAAILLASAEAAFPCGRQAGYPIVPSRPSDRRRPSHRRGTACRGADPRAGVVNPFCRSHDHPNLFVVDTSVLPTSAAVNPALTITALWAGEHIKRRDLAA